VKKIVAVLLPLAIFLIVFFYTAIPFNFDGFISPVPEYVPAGNRPPEFGAWLAYWDEDLAIENLTLGLPVQSISPVWYVLDGTAALTQSPHQKGSEIIALAKKNTVQITPTIFNDFDGERVANLIGDKAKIADFLDTLITIIDDHDFAGIDLDLEVIEEDDKLAFSRLVDAVGQLVHQKGKLLSVTVHAKAGKNDWPGSLGQDWQEISKYADRVRIMVYDYHNSKTEPGSISPIDYLEDVVDYAVSQIPLAKIVIALPLYGYDWSQEKDVIPLTYEAISSMVNKNRIEVQLEKQSFSKHFDYQQDGVGHEVWFEDAQTLEQKIRLVQSKGINKFYFWKLGGEDKRVWEIK